MSRFEQDTIKRQIRQMGDALAALVARAHETQDYESGLEAVREAAEKGFGPDRLLLDRFDPESAALLLPDAESLRVYAEVCRAESELLERLGRGDEAEALRVRAERLEQIAAR